MPITYSERITIAMGMSASQARLLTITGKLTDNELRSQTITNSKLRLAQKSSEASQAYMDALNTEKLTYKYYNDNGESASYNLTPALIYSYEPLKNQYSIQNASGQNLVSATDAKNYEETDSLAGFLDRYGLLEKVTGTKTEYIDNPAYEAYLKEHPAPDKTDPIYWIEDGSTNIDYTYYDKFLNATKICYGSIMSVLYTRLNIDPPTTAMENSEGQPILKYSKDANNIVLASYYSYDTNDWVNIVPSGYAKDTDCYNHVLTHLLEIGDYTASDGTSLSILPKGLGGNKLNQYWWAEGSPDTDSREWRLENAEELRKLFSEKADEILYCSKNFPVDITQNSSDIEKLLSNYVIDSNGESQLKTIQQKMVDLFVATQKCTDQQLFDALERFVNIDIVQAISSPDKIFDEDGYNKDYDDWKNGLPPKTITKTKTIDDIAINDKSKGQWYTNLWYMMNGSETANVVVEDKDSEENLFKVNGAEKNLKMSNSSNYKVIDDQLFTSNEWLTFALKNGIVTLKQALYFNPATDSGKVAELNSEGYFWNPTAYSSTTDIVAVEDEVAIAKAEVKYKNTTTEIENQDKKYDQDLKKLDSEHNALQTEYESLKSVIDKNVERSFKAFS